MMKIAVKETGDILVVSPDSSILQENVPLLRSRLQKLVEEDGWKWVVLDMSNANYLSSVGVSVIVETKRRTGEKGGDTVLACVNHLIHQLLDMTNVLRRVEVYPTVEEAIEGLSGKADLNR